MESTTHLTLCKHMTMYYIKCTRDIAFNATEMQRKSKLDLQLNVCVCVEYQPHIFLDVKRSLETRVPASGAKQQRVALRS